MKPIGQAIAWWRNQKGLTQVEVARRSGISRPNLSAIEQGARDLTIQTLYRIAAALEVKPGLLVDGETPRGEQPGPDRQALDRIARKVAGENVRISRADIPIITDLKAILKSKLQCAFPGDSSAGSVRAENAALQRLKAGLGPELLRHLIGRVEKHLPVTTHE